MTRNEYLNALAAAMEGLPENEVRQTLDYYDELISDAMEAGESEQEAVGTLPAPEDAADDLRPRRMRRNGVPGCVWAVAAAAVCILAALVILNVTRSGFSRGTEMIREDQAPVEEQAAAESGDSRYAMTERVQSFPAEELTSFDLESGILSLKLVAEDREDVEVRYYDCPACLCTVEAENGQLKLRYADVRFDTPEEWKNLKYTVTVRVPTAYTARYETEADMGRTVVEGCRGQFSLTADMGSVEVRDCAAETLEIKCSMGGVTVSDSAGGRLELRCDMGGVTLDAADFEELDIQADFGSVEGTLAGSRADYDVACEVDMGKSSLENGGGGPRKLSVACDMGNVDLSFLK